MKQGGQLQHASITLPEVIFPKPGNGGQFQSSGREIFEEWAFTHREVNNQGEVMLGKCRLDHDWQPKHYTLGAGSEVPPFVKGAALRGLEAFSAEGGFEGA